MILMLCLMVAYVLETERRIIKKYPQIVEQFKAKVEPHLAVLK